MGKVLIKLTSCFIFLFHFVVWNLKCTGVLSCHRNLTMKMSAPERKQTSFWAFDFFKNNIIDYYHPIRLWLTSHICNYLLWIVKLSTHRQKSKGYIMWLLQDFLVIELIENNRNVHHLVLKVRVLLNSRCTYNLLFYFIIVII